MITRKMLLNVQLSKRLRVLSPRPMFGPGLCSVYLKLLWLGRGSQILANRVPVCFPAVRAYVVFGTASTFSLFAKYSLPYLQNSLVIYKFM